MSRVIKFQFLYKGLPFSSLDKGFNWHKKVYSLNDFIDKGLSSISDVHGTCELIAKRQFTESVDINGNPIYEGDILTREKNCMYSAGRETEIVGFDGGQFVSGDACLTNVVESFLPEVIGNIYQNPELLEGDK